MKIKINHASSLFRIFFPPLSLLAFNSWGTPSSAPSGTASGTASGRLTSCPKIADSVVSFVFSYHNGFDPSRGMFCGTRVQWAKKCFYEKLKGCNQWGLILAFAYFLDKCRAIVCAHGAIAQGVAPEGLVTGAAPLILGQETACSPQRTQYYNTVYGWDEMGDALGEHHVWRGQEGLNCIDQPGDVFGILGSVYPKTCSVSMQKRMRQSWYV